MSELRVIHRDGALLVVDKPPGLPTTSPDGRGCLVERVRAFDPDADVMHPTSRLDRDVSGVVTFARNRGAIATLLRARRAGLYERTYLAIVEGEVAASEGTWSWPIAVDVRDRRLRIAVRDGESAADAQSAESSFRRLARARESTALALHPRTGRTHQLRVHASAAGAPILGDVAYGGRPRVALSDGRVITASRPLLHCARVVIPNVARGRGELVLVAPIPDDLASVWQRLGGEALRLPPSAIASPT